MTMNCDVCGSRTRINWGDSSTTLCKSHFISANANKSYAATEIRHVFPPVGIVVVLISHIVAFGSVLHTCFLLAIVLIGVPLVWIIIPLLIYWIVELFLGIYGSARAVTSLLLLDFIFIFAYLPLQETPFLWPKLALAGVELHIPSILLVLSFYYTLNPAYERNSNNLA